MGLSSTELITILEDIGKRSLKLGMIIGPGVGFLFQAYKIWKQRNPEGYSNFVSFILLIANISRIPFWLVLSHHRIGREDPVSYVVLFASLFMIIVQVVPLLLIVHNDLGLHLSSQPSSFKSP